MFWILQRFFLLPFLQRNCGDFTEISFIYYKISVNFTKNLQEKYQHFMDILCNL